MRLKILGSCALGALAMAACSQQPANPSAASDASASAAAAQPLAPPSPAETAPAPAASALPAAQPAPVRYAPATRQYGELNEADAMSQTYADAPPDYAFDYDGQAPEVWGSQDGVVRVAERVPGGWRYFYYRPGSATPYLVRDPDYAYGFDGSELVVVYDSRGRALPPEWGDRQAWLAGRYLARGHDLWRAARERRRMEIEDQVWRDQQADQERQRRYWDETRAADPDWRAWHEAHEAEARDRWVGIAAAWAAAQAAGPAPRDGWSQPRDGGVGAARQAWWGRMAQGPGPAQPPAQPPAQGWTQQTPGGPMQPAARGWDGHPHQGPGPAQPPAQPPAQRGGWSTPEQGPGPAQPPAQPPARGWDGRNGGHGQPERPQGWNGQPQTQPQHPQGEHPQGEHPHPIQPQAPAEHPHGAQPQAPAEHPHPAQPQAPAEHPHPAQPAAPAEHAHPAQPAARAEHAHPAQPPAKGEHNGKPEDHGKKPENR